MQRFTLTDVDTDKIPVGYEIMETYREQYGGSFWVIYDHMKEKVEDIHTSMTVAEMACKDKNETYAHDPETQLFLHTNKEKVLSKDEVRRTVMRLKTDNLTKIEMCDNLGVLDDEK